MSTSVNNVDQLIKGAYDLHIHTGPSFFKRSLDDLDMAELALQAQMKGFLIKAHEGSTVCRAYLAKKYINDQVNVCGGHVMNIHSGGLNPHVVDAQIKLGAKIIWFPTMSADNHIKHFGAMKFGSMKSTKNVMAVEEGLTVIDADGKLLPEVEKILELIASADICLSTGHLGNEEVYILTQKAFEKGINRVLINHPDFETNRMPLSKKQALVKQGAYLEMSFLSLHPNWNPIEPEEMVEGIKQVGYEKCILTTDYGSEGYPDPVEGFKSFLKTMLDLGLTKDQITTMIKDNPAYLMNDR